MIIQLIEQSCEREKAINEYFDKDQIWIKKRVIDYNNKGVAKVVAPTSTGSTLLNCDIFFTEIEDALYYTAFGSIVDLKVELDRDSDGEAIINLSGLKNNRLKNILPQIVIIILIFG